MARRRHRRHIAHKRSGISKLIAPGAFALAFLGQITGKDFAQGAPQATAFQNADSVGKFKFLTNDVVGRMSGINPFGDATQFKQTINPAGMINKYVGLGLLFNIFYPMIPRVPGKGIARKAGGALIGGGILGGLFDDPTNLANVPPSQSYTGTQAGASPFA